jgi:hypothetical protein
VDTVAEEEVSFDREPDVKINKNDVITCSGTHSR